VLLHAKMETKTIINHERVGVEEFYLPYLFREYTNIVKGKQKIALPELKECREYTKKINYLNSKQPDYYNEGILFNHV
jgi:hypothetical protein